MSGDARALLARLPGCARLGPEALAHLVEVARTQEYPQGARLVAEGEPAPDWYALVESGAVQVSRVAVEADEILDYLSEGEVLDPGTPGMPATYTASVVEPARCLLVPQAAVGAQRAAAGSGPPAASARGDLALFVGRVRDLLKSGPVTCGPDTPVADAARSMTRRRVGSVIVVDAAGAPLGIVTDRDLRTRVVAEALPASAPVSAVMSHPLLSIDPDQLAFDALLEMTRRNIHHLAVMSGARLEGVVSSHDLIWLQGAHPVALAREIDAHGSLEELAGAGARIQGVVKWLSDGGAGPFQIGRIVAELNDRLVRRTVEIIEAALERGGHGRPPVPYSWIAAGSEGRREQTLKTDQDNGLVYEDPPGPLREAAAAYFGRLASEAGAALVRIGFPPCPGGFMASTPRWCQPASVWREHFASWMENPHPEPLLHAAIFFDLRPVAGAEAPGRALWEWICARAPARALFLRYMARAAAERQPPLGFFGGFVVERSGVHEGRLDIKARGVFPVTQAMRVYALSLGLVDTNTLDRLAKAGPAVGLTPAEIQELREGYEVICRLRLRHQLGCVEAGVPPDNFIDPQGLGKADRLLLKEAFKTMAWLLKGLEERFLTAGLV